MKINIVQPVFFYHFLQNFLIVTLAIQIELYRSLSPFHLIKKFNSQVLSFMNACKIRWNGYFYAVSHRWKRDRTVSVNMKWIVMYTGIRNFTIESSFHYLVVVMARKKYFLSAKIPI